MTFKPYLSLSPRLSFKNAKKAISFYQKAFKATELMRLTGPTGEILHAELQVGNGKIMLSDENPKFHKSAETLGETPIILHLYVDDVDTMATEAVTAGAELIYPVEDQFYGDRCCRLKDPFGYIWIVATRKEELPVEEMQKRADGLFAKN